MTSLPEARTVEADARFERLHDHVLARIARLLDAAAIDPASVVCAVEGHGSTVTVVLDLPMSVSRGLEHALGVRVLDAVRSSGLTFGRVGVVVHAPERTDGRVDAMTDAGASTLEEIPVEECFELVAALGVGRFAVAIPGRAPLVVPVNYVLDGDVIVFRSDYGTKIAGLRRRQVSFQVDLIDPVHRTGWSVLVQGVAHEATDDEVAHLSLAPWVGEKEHWIRVVPTVVTGRRIKLPAITLDSQGYL